MKITKKKLAECIAGVLFTPVVWAGCGINQGGNPALAVEPGDYCVISEGQINGANAVWTYGPSTLIFTAQDAIINGGGGQSHTLGIGGRIHGDKHSGADVIFDNNAYIYLSSNGASRGIYMHPLDDSGLGNTLTIYGSFYGVIRSAGGGAALDLSNEGNAATIYGDYTTVHRASSGDGIRNSGDLYIGGDVTIGELNGNPSSTGIYSRDGGVLNIDGRTNIYSVRNALESRDTTVANFQGGVSLLSQKLATIAIQDKAKITLRHLEKAEGPSFLNITGGALTVKKMDNISVTENAINYLGGQVNIDGGGVSANNGQVLSQQGNIIDIGNVDVVGSNALIVNKLSSVEATTGSIVNLNNGGSKSTTTSLKKIDNLTAGGPLISIGAANATNNIVTLDSITNISSLGGLFVGAGSGTTTLNIVNTRIEDPGSVNDVNVSSGRVDINLNASHTSNSYNSSASGILNLNINQGSSATVNNNFTLTTINNRGDLILGSGTRNASINADVNNASTLVISAPGAGSQANRLLTINGNYTGSSAALIQMSASVANGDSSSSDRLIVNGNTAGSTKVSIELVSDPANSTAMTKGLEMVRVTGESNGDFTLSERVTAGGYEYLLTRGQNNAAKNWYLTSQVKQQPVAFMSAAMLYMPVVADDASAASSFISLQQPEAGSYSSNIQAANTLFNVTLHDRLGETRYIDALTGEEQTTSLWLRQVGGHNRSHMGNQLSTKANRYVAQLGGDLAQWSTDGDNRFHVGMMAGYANQHSNTVSNITGYHSKGITRGYSAGLYGTWFASDEQKGGLYVDSWAQYNWFTHTVKGDGLASEKYDSRGVSASLETGYALKAAEYTTTNNMVNSFWLEPQLQVTWMGVKAKDHTERNGYRVKGLGNNNVQTRLGMRAYLKGHSAIDTDKNRDFEPFVEANWIHNTKQFGVRMGEFENHINGARNIGEVKVGVESKVNQRVNLWGSIAQQVGNKGYSDTQGVLGVKYLF